MPDPDPPVRSLPVLPLKNTVLLPFSFIPLSVGRPASLAAVDAVLAGEEKTFVAAAPPGAGPAAPASAGPSHPGGTPPVVKKMARGEGAVELLVQGVERVALLALEQTTPYVRARVRPLPTPDDGGPEAEALYRAVLDLARRVLELSQAPVNLDQL